MKNYILKLIDSDIALTKFQLSNWEKMDDKWKLDSFQIKHNNALKNKLEKAFQYK